MPRRLKVLVTSSYPAPYRVGVFRELAKTYDLDVFFDTCQNENRNADWFCKSGELVFEILDNPVSKKHFKEKISDIGQYDFVIAYDSTRKPSRKAILRCRVHGVPYYLNSDGVIPHNTLKNRIIKRLVYPFLFGGARACFSSGKSATDNFMNYGVPRERIFEHHFTSLTEDDILREPIGEEQKARFRQELGLPGSPLVLTIGQFIPRKGFDILLHAWAKVRSDATLLIIGGGDDRPLYEQIIGEEKLTNVKLLDFMQKSELYRYYKAADIFVLPTREDIWGLVVNEAMGQGLPVIATDKCNAGLEMVEEGKNGFIVPVGDVEMLARRLDELLENPSETRAMAESNLLKIQSWTMANVAKRHIEAIESTLKGQNGYHS